MLACPMCKPERLRAKFKQEFKKLRNHMKRKHKQLKFYLVRSRYVFEMPIGRTQLSQTEKSESKERERIKKLSKV